MSGEIDVMYEIGSEFHENSSNNGENKYIDLVGIEKRYVLSGRTAIAYIIKDILTRSEFKKVALPEYCCASMIEPFVFKGVEIIFYGIYSNYEEIFENADVVLVMDYFGYGSESTLKFAELCKSKRKILVVDATQTAFSRLKTYQLADYVLVSYRKWTDCLCAAVYSRNGFLIDAPEKKNDVYVASWRSAATMKRKYLLYGSESKVAFLDLYRNANKLLWESYEDSIAPKEEIERFESIDSDYLRYRRRANAMILIKAIIKNSKGRESSARLMYENLGEEDCPLFVPIFVNAAIRDKIQKQLIDAGCFCPIHWPIDLKYPYVRAEYYDREISLICDQRYGEKEIMWEAEKVSKAIRKYDN